MFVIFAFLMAVTFFAAYYIGKTLFEATIVTFGVAAITVMFYYGLGPMIRDAIYTTTVNLIPDVEAHCIVCNDPIGSAMMYRYCERRNCENDHCIKCVDKMAKCRLCGSLCCIDCSKEFVNDYCPDCIDEAAGEKS
jgi:hypothetical protein